MPLYRVEGRVRGGFERLVVADSEEDAEKDGEINGEDWAHSLDVEIEAVTLVAGTHDLMTGERQSRVYDGRQWCTAAEWLEANPVEDAELSEEDRARIYRESVEAAGQQRIPGVAV